MKTFRRDEIINKHGQRIYMFVTQPGITELEKCINFITSTKQKFIRYDTITKDALNISIIVSGDYMEIFNDIGEKISEGEINIEPYNVYDLIEDLSDLGYNI